MSSTENDRAAQPADRDRAVEGLDDVTRFGLIDETGRAVVRYGVAVQVHVQDEGRTVKVFLRGRP